LASRNMAISDTLGNVAETATMRNTDFMASGEVLA
jgi:hypothetical protein